MNSESGQSKRDGFALPTSPGPPAISRCHTAVLVICVAGAMSACGSCAFFGPDGLWTRHTEKDRRDAAKQRWDEVRGGVKLQVAEHHFEAGRLDEAEAVLRSALGGIAMSPRSALGGEAYKLAARLYLEQGRLAEARAAILAALSLAGDDAAVHYLAGMVEERYENLESAIDHYEKAEALGPNVVEYVMAAAETRAALGEPLRGLEIVERRIRDFDGSGPLRLLAAELSRALGRRAAAIAHSQTVLQMGGGDPPEADLVEAALTLNWAGAHAEAIAVLEPIALGAQQKGNLPGGQRDDGRDPPGSASGGSSVVIKELARAYAGADRWEEAAALLRPMMRNDKRDAFAWCLSARAALAMGDVREAHRVISEFNGRQPVRAEALLLEAYLCRELGLEGAAGRAAARALEIDAELQEAAWIVSSASGGDEHAAPAIARGPAEPTETIPARRDTESDPAETGGLKSIAVRKIEGDEETGNLLRVEACTCSSCVRERNNEPWRDSSSEVAGLSDSEDRNRTGP